MNTAASSRYNGPASPAVLDEEQRRLLTAVLNRIVPAGNGLPGAGDLGVGATVESTLGQAPAQRRLLLDGLTEIQLASGRGAGRDFTELEAEQQDDVLRDVESAHPAFFSALVDHTYRGYYTLPAVHAAIGYESRPPQPLGHELPPFDPSLLDKQRQRPPFWRRTS